MFYKRGKVAIFLHTFPKSRKANLSKSELAMYLEAAEVLVNLNEEALFALRAKKGWRAIDI